MRAYKEIYSGVGKVFEAVSINASNSEAPASAMVMEAIPENPSDLEAVAKPTGSFTAKIDELMGQVHTLTAELEQSRLAASQAEMLNRELGASLEAAQSNANALQEENERIKEACHRNTLAADFFRAKAVQLDAVIKDISSTVESAKAIVCHDP
jgi:chromosome segregation ATPase